jgi:hypothetical protein
MFLDVNKQLDILAVNFETVLKLDNSCYKETYKQNIYSLIITTKS